MREGATRREMERLEGAYISLPAHVSRAGSGARLLNATSPYCMSIEDRFHLHRGRLYPAANKR